MKGLQTIALLATSAHMILCGAAAVDAHKRDEACVPSINPVSNLYNLKQGGLDDMKACTDSKPPSGKPSTFGGPCKGLEGRVACNVYDYNDGGRRADFPSIYKCVKDGQDLFWQRQLECTKENIGLTSSGGTKTGGDSPMCQYGGSGDGWKCVNYVPLPPIASATSQIQ